MGREEIGVRRQKSGDGRQETEDSRQGVGVIIINRKFMFNKGGNLIKSFSDLVSWQKGHLIVINIYKLTRKFPKDELFVLTAQIRRAAVSITSNISEGFGRKSIKEKLKFYYYSLGSINEVKNQLLIAKDLNYIAKDEFKNINEKIIEFSKLLEGLIKSTTRRLNE